MTTLLKCLACGEIRQMRDGRNRCACGRSAAKVDGTVVEIAGPARVLVPEDGVVTVDGVPWIVLPEEPMLVRRANAVEHPVATSR